MKKHLLCPFVANPSVIEARPSHCSNQTVSGWQPSVLLQKIARRNRERCWGLPLAGFHVGAAKLRLLKFLCVELQCERMMYYRTHKAARCAWLLLRQVHDPVFDNWLDRMQENRGAVPWAAAIWFGENVHNVGCVSKFLISRRNCGGEPACITCRLREYSHPSGCWVAHRK